MPLHDPAAKAYFAALNKYAGNPPDDDPDNPAGDERDQGTVRANPRIAGEELTRLQAAAREAEKAGDSRALLDIQDRMMMLRSEGPYGPKIPQDSAIPVPRYVDPLRGRTADLVGRRQALEAPDAHTQDLIQRRAVLESARQRRDALDRARAPSADPANLAPQNPEWLGTDATLNYVRAYHDFQAQRMMARMQDLYPPPRKGVDNPAGMALQQALAGALMQPVANMAHQVNPAVVPRHLLPSVVEAQASDQPETQPLSSSEARRVNKLAPGE